MTRKYCGLVVFLLSLGYCYALQDEVGYLAYTLNDLARFLPAGAGSDAPGGDDGSGPVGSGDGGVGKPDVPGGGSGDKPVGGSGDIKGPDVKGPDVKPAPGSGKIAGEAPTLAARNIVHAAGDVMQRAAADIKKEERTFGLSGYVSVYYALSELSRSLKGKEIPMPFDDFRQRAFRAIKAYRLEVACRHYIVEQLMASFMPKEDFLKIKFNFGISPLAMWEIYHSLVSDLATVQAKRYVQVNYDAKKDTLQPSPFEVSGKTLISDIANIVNTRIDRYLQQAQKTSPGTKRAAIIANLNEQPLFEKITQITPAKTWKFTSREVLVELHSKNSFGRAEGFIPKSAAAVDLASLMPKGFSLGSDELELLLWDWSELKTIGLTSQETRDNCTVLDALNLLILDDPSFLGSNAQEQWQASKFLLQGRAEDKTVRSTVHVFIVNANYDHNNPGTTPNWVVITRYPNKQYVVVDIQDNNRTDDINVQLIQRAFGDL